MSAAVLAGALAGVGVYLLWQRELVRVIFGFVLLGHAVNVVLLAAGGLQRRGLPFAGAGPLQQTADPLPQAFVLTAIVITFGITVYLLALTWRTGDTDDPGPNNSGPNNPGPGNGTADGQAGAP